MTGTWSVEQTAALIECYENQPILYTVSHPRYHNKYARQQAMEEIVESLQHVRPNTRVTEIKANINYLRARFNAEFAKMRSKPTGSGAEIAKITFMFFEKFLFLKDHIAPRKGFCNLPQTKQGSGSDSWLDIVEEDKDAQNYEMQSVDVDEDDVELNSTLICTPSPSTSASTSSSATTGPVSPAIPNGKSRKRKASSDAQEDFLKQPSSALDLLSKNEPKTDEWDDFGNFVASSIRRLKTNKMKCKHDLLKVIMAYEEDETIE